MTKTPSKQQGPGTFRSVEAMTTKVKDGLTTPGPKVTLGGKTRADVKAAAEGVSKVQVKTKATTLIAGDVYLHLSRRKVRHSNAVQFYERPIRRSDASLDIGELKRAAGLPEFYDATELMFRAEQGVPVGVIPYLKHWVPADIVSNTIASSSTLSRRMRDDELLVGAEADRTLRMVAILDKAVMVFGNPLKAQRWLSKPKQFLDPQGPGRSPYDMLESEHGARVVEERLGQIEHGLFA